MADRKSLVSLVLTVLVVLSPMISGVTFATEGVTNPSELPDSQVFVADEEGQIEVWERALFTLRTDDTDAATQIPPPTQILGESLGSGSFTEGDDGTNSKRLVRYFGGDRNPMGVHQAGSTVSIAFDVGRVAGGLNLADQPRIEFVAAKLTSMEGAGSQTSFSEAIQLLGNERRANENASFRILRNSNSQDVNQLNGTTATLQEDFSAGQWMIYAVVHEEGHAGIETGRTISNSSLSADLSRHNMTIDGDIVVVGMDQVTVQRASAAVSEPTDTYVGSNLTFDVDASPAFTEAANNITHTVLLYDKSRFENSSLDIVVDQDALGTSSSLADAVQLEPSIGQIDGKVRVEEGASIFGNDLANGHVAGATGIANTIDFLSEEIGSDLPGVAPIEDGGASDSRVEQLSASLTAITGESPQASVAVQTFADFPTGDYQYVVVSKAGDNSSAISTTTGTISLGEPPNQIVASSIQDETVVKGANVSVLVTVEAPADSGITRTLTLTAKNGTAYTEKQIIVDAGERKTVELQAPTKTIGTRTLSVNGLVVGTVDVLPPEERAFSVSKESVEVGEPFSLVVTVRNNRASSAEIQVNPSGLPSDAPDTKSVTVAGESRAFVTFDSLTYSTPGQREISLENVSRTESITVTKKDVRLRVNADLPVRPVPGRNVSFEVIRTDTGNPVDDVTFQFEKIDAETSIPNATNVAPPINRSFESAGQYRVTVTKASETINFISDSTTVTIRQPANISLVSASTPVETVIASTTLPVQATIENTGGVPGEQTLRVVTAEDNTTVATRTVDVPAQSTRQIILSGPLQPAGTEVPANRSLAVQAVADGDVVQETDLGTVTVTPAVRVTSISPQARLITSGEAAHITVTVRNIGTSDLKKELDDQDVTVVLEGREPKTKNFAPDPGSNLTETYTFDNLDEIGNRTLTIERQFAENITIQNAIQVTSQPVYDVRLSANRTTIVPGHPIAVNVTSPGEPVPVSEPSDELEATLQVLQDTEQGTEIIKEVRTTNGTATFNLSEPGVYFVNTTNHSQTINETARPDPGRLQVQVQESGDLQIVDAYVTTPTVSKTQQVNVTAVVANTGGTNATETISLVGQTNAGASQNVTVRPGEAKRVQLGTSFSTVGVRSLAVTTSEADEPAVPAGKVAVEPVLRVSDIQVTPSRSVNVSENVAVEVTVQNFGSVTVSGSEIDRQINLSVTSPIAGVNETRVSKSAFVNTDSFAPDDTSTITFTPDALHPVSRPGQRVLTVDGLAAGSVFVSRQIEQLNLSISGNTVGEPVTFDVTSAGDPVNATLIFPDRAPITTGAADGTVTKTFDNPFSGRVRAVKDPTRTTLYVDASQFVTVSEPADIVVTSGSVNTVQAYAGQEVTVTATALNIGGQSGHTEIGVSTQDSDTARATQQVGLGPGEQTTVTFTPEVTNIGAQTLVVENTTAGTVFVDEAVAITDINVPSAARAGHSFGVDVTVTDRVDDQKTGSKNVTISVGTRAESATITPKDGKATTHTFTFAFDETGTKPVTIDTADLENETIGDVSIANETVPLSLNTSPSPATVASGEPVTFTVNTTEGPVDATVTVAGQLLNTGDDGQVQTTIPLAGNYTATATKAGQVGTAYSKATQTVTVQDPLQISPDTVSFGDTPAHPRRGSARPPTASATEAVTITNSGGRPISVGGFGFIGADADQYRIISSVPSTIPAQSSRTVDVAFRPTVRNTTSAKLRFRTDTASPIRTVPLSGTGQAGNVTVSTTSVNFGSTLQETDLSVEKTLTIQNDGNAPVTITPKTAFLENAFSVDKGSRTLADGESVTYTVTFDPDSNALPGSFGDTLRFSTDGDPFAGSIAVGLSGTVSQGELTVAPTSFDIGDLAVGDSETVDVVVRNSGTKTIDSVTVNHNTETDGLKFTSPAESAEVVSALQPGEAELVEIQVTQTADASSSSAKLELVRTGEASNRNVTLQASPQAPALSVTPSVDDDPTTDEVRFGDVAVRSTTTEQLSIDNTGTAPLTLTNIRISGQATGPFSLAGVPTTMTVPAGEQRIIPVQFNPLTAGTFADGADLTFAWNDPAVEGTSPVSVDLAGRGIQTSLTGNTSSISFGTIGSGSTITSGINLTNDGNAELTLNDADISLSGSDAAQFSVDKDALANALAAGDSDVLPVSYTPTTAGSHTALVKIIATSNETGQVSTYTATVQGTATPPDVELSKSTLRFGFVNNRTDATTTAQTLIMNAGRPTTTLTISNISVSGNDAFSLTHTPDAAGKPVEVAFAPDANDAGQLRGTLTIQTNDPDEPTVNVALVGTATAPDPTANRSQIAFGTVRTDSQSATQAVRITNDGGVPLDVTSTSLRSTTHFTLVSDATGVLVPGETATVQVRASPSTAGDLSTELLVTTNGTDDISAIPITVDSIRPNAVVSADLSGDFAETRVSSSTTQTMTVRNSGEATLTLANITASGDAFSVLNGQSTIRLGPGDAATLTVAFSPVAVGEADGTLSIETNDDTTGTIIRALTGTGQEADVTLSQSAIDFGTVSVDTSRSQQLTITNDGSADLRLIGASVAGTDSSAFSVSGLGTTTLAHGESQTFNVSVSPTLATDLSAKIRILTGEGQQNVNISLGATGIEPDLQVSRQRVTFPRTRLGTTSVETVQLNNTGNAPANVRDILLASDTDQFDLSFESAVIPAKGSRTLRIRFAPPVSDVDAAKQGTQRTASLTVLSNDTDQSAIDIDVTAQSKTPKLEVPNVLRFGTLRIGEDTRQPLEVTNAPSATANLNLTDLVVLGRNASTFSVDVPADTELAPGETATIGVVATPELPGRKTASLLVSTGDPRESLQSVSLSNTRTVVIVRYGSVTFDYNGVTTTDPKAKSSNGPNTKVVGIDPTLNSVTDFEMAFSKRSPTAGPQLASNRPISPVRYLDISTVNLTPTEHNATTVQFRVQKTTLNSLNTPRDGIALYQYNGSAYEAVSTERLPSKDTATAYAYSAPIDSFNDLAVGAGQPRLTIDADSVAVSGVPETLASGDTTQVTVTVDVSNTGTVAGSDTFSVTESDGTVLTRTQVSVDAGATKTVSFSPTLAGPGERTLTVQGADTSSDAVSINIAQPEDEPAEPGPEPGPAPDPGPGPAPPDDDEPTPPDDDEPTPPGQDQPTVVTPPITHMNGTSVTTVETVTRDTVVALPVNLTVTGADGDVSVSQVNVTAAANASNVQIEVTAANTPPTDIPRLDQPALGYLTVGIDQLSDANTSSGQFVFTVSQSVLNQRNVAPSDIVMYRYHDGRYSAIATTHLGGNRFQATTPGFSTFAIGVREQPQQQPSITVTSASLNTTTAQTDDAVGLTVTVENTGGEQGTVTLDVTANENVVATSTVTVPAGDTVTRSLTVTFDSPGSYEIAVNGTSAGTVSVTDEPTSPTPTPPTEEPTQSPAGTETPSEDGDGLLPILVILIVIVLAAAGVAYYLRED